MSKITSLVKGFSSPLRAPYVYGKLDCGHTCDIELKDSTFKCKCGAEYSVSSNFYRPDSCPSCGTKGTGNYVFQPDPHDEDHHNSKVGDERHCQRCDSYQANLQQLKNLDWSTVAHSRYREWGGKGAYYVYRRAPESPSGVLLEMTIEATQEAEDLLSARGNSPLSPTEGL